MAEATARANANVALAKYWGKRDETLNLPFTGSLSVTLAGLVTTVTVKFDAAVIKDRIFLNDTLREDIEAERVSRFVDLVRSTARLRDHAEVHIASNFPVAAGIASSASTFAALARAATAAADLHLSDRELSILARQGSGSAARSVLGGFVEWSAGEASDGADSYAVQVAPPEHWALGVVVAITEEGPKKIGSREGMMRVVRDSPFFPAWLGSHAADLTSIRDGIRERDFDRVGQTAEHNCLKMHAVCLGARPPLLYWNPATVAAVRRVTELREEGIPAYFTIDAGPQVKVLCPLDRRSAVAEALAAVSGVGRVLLSQPGAGVDLISSDLRNEEPVG